MLSEKRVIEILNDLESRGLVEKIWSEKKQDYVWGKTEFGKQVYKELQKSKRQKAKHE